LKEIHFRCDVPLEHTVAFELIYPPSEQLSLPEKHKFFDGPGSIFVWMFVDGELAGETYGIAVTNSLPGLADLSDEQRKTSIHCYSNTILPAFQNQGLGKTVKAHWLALAAARGLKTVYGYARPGASQALNASFGAIFLQGFPNWCDTGEEYQLYRLEL
jgi:GNAT superfamily N-acetyltransferase